MHVVFSTSFYLEIIENEIKQELARRHELAGEEMLRAYMDLETMTPLGTYAYLTVQKWSKLANRIGTDALWCLCFVFLPPSGPFSVIP